MLWARGTLPSLNVATTGRNYQEEIAMRDSLDEMVRNVVARHLQVASATITAKTQLVRELDLDPLDLVLIALRIEEREGIEFPIARLEGTSTVGDLIGIVRTMRATRARRAEEAAFTLDAPWLKLAVGA
jgi:acyl carrier protein